MKQLNIVVWLLTAILFTFPAMAKSEALISGEHHGARFQVNQLASGLGVPWGLVFIDNSQILFTEQRGSISILDTRSGDIIRLSGVPKVAFAGQGGLLDVAIPGDYQDGDWIYFTYSKPNQPGAVTTLSRARLNGDRLVDWRDLLVTRSATKTTRHFGSRIAFDHQGHLFFSIGDRGHRPNGQDLSTHAGSILRVTMDGTSPPTNPFVHDRSARPEIWSYGHRNPQGIAYDMSRNILWAIEHGPRGGDEINRIQPGLNYGWATISHGKEYWGPVQVGEGREKSGMEQPVKIYIPSIAPGSLMVYDGASFPSWRGDLFAGALKLTHINHILLDQAGNVKGEKRFLESLDERVRALIQGPEGNLYFSTDSGKIFSISPAQS